MLAQKTSAWYLCASTSLQLASKGKRPHNIVSASTANSSFLTQPAFRTSLMISVSSLLCLTIASLPAKHTERLTSLADSISSSVAQDPSLPGSLTPLGLSSAAESFTSRPVVRGAMLRSSFACGCAFVFGIVLHYMFPASSSRTLRLHVPTMSVVALRSLKYMRGLLYSVCSLTSPRACFPIGRPMWPFVHNVPHNEETAPACRLVPATWRGRPHLPSDVYSWGIEPVPRRTGKHATHGSVTLLVCFVLQIQRRILAPCLVLGLPARLHLAIWLRTWTVLLHCCVVSHVVQDAGLMVFLLISYVFYARSSPRTSWETSCSSLMFCFLLRLWHSSVSDRDAASLCRNVSKYPFLPWQGAEGTSTDVLNSETIYVDDGACLFHTS